MTVSPTLKSPNFAASRSFRNCVFALILTVTTLPSCLVISMDWSCTAVNLPNKPGRLSPPRPAICPLPVPCAALGFCAGGASWRARAIAPGSVPTAEKVKNETDKTLVIPLISAFLIPSLINLRPSAQKSLLLPRLKSLDGSYDLGSFLEHHVAHRSPIVRRSVRLSLASFRWLSPLWPAYGFPRHDSLSVGS